MRSRLVRNLLAVVAVAMATGPPVAHAEPDAFVATITTVNGTTTIGQRTAFDPFGPPHAPPAALNGPVTAGNVKGQFDFACSEGPGGGSNPATDCPDAAYVAAHLNFKWGVIKVTGPNKVFLQNGGNDLFPSDLALNEGFTFVDPAGFDGNPFTRLAHFEFNLESQNITLDPSSSYVIFALLSEFVIPSTVPGEGSTSPENSIYGTSIDPVPFQYHQAFPAWDPTGNTNQVATSGLIPVVPEPITGLMAVFVGLGLVRGRRIRH